MGATQTAQPFRTPVPVGTGTFHGINSQQFVPMRKPFGSNNLMMNLSKNGPGGNSPPQPGFSGEQPQAQQ